MRSIIFIVARAAAGAIAVGLLYALWPSAILSPIALVASRATAMLNPWIEEVSVEMRDRTVLMEGVIRANMILEDGTLLEPARGTWRQDGMLYATMAAIGAAVLAGAARRYRASSWGLLVALCVAAGAAGLSVSLQRFAMEGIGSQWLPTLRFADTPDNILEFERMRRWYRALAAADSALGGGGLTALGVACGIAAAAEAKRTRKRSPAPMPT